MRRIVVAVALVTLVVLAGCSAVEINRPADEASNETGTDAGPGAPTDDAAETDREDGDDAEDTETEGEQAANGNTPTATEEGAASDRTTTAPTATPEVNRIELTNDGERDYVVSVTVTRGPIEAVRLDLSSEETDIVVLEGRALADVLTFDTVDVRPIEVVEATAEYEIDPEESFARALPGEDRQHVLVEVREEDEGGTVVGGAVFDCSPGESLDDVTVTVDGDGADVAGECLG